jgi:hypothetical protein
VGWHDRGSGDDVCTISQRYRQKWRSRCSGRAFVEGAKIRDGQESRCCCGEVSCMFLPLYGQGKLTVEGASFNNGSDSLSLP